MAILVNILPKQKQVEIIKLLSDGLAIRAVERFTSVHRDTIVRLIIRIGDHCQQMLDKKIINLPCSLVQCDEIWGFVSKKDKSILPHEEMQENIGSQFLFIGMDSQTKLILAHKIGKRTSETTRLFIKDLSKRIAGKPNIVTDGFDAYPEAIEEVFGANVNYAQLVKYMRSDEPGKTAVINHMRNVIGFIPPSLISTSLIERQNLTVRMCMRRMTRKTNAFSKTLAGLIAATQIHFCYYNFCRVHQTLRVTPAMAAGITNQIWTIDMILPACNIPGFSN